MITALLYLKKGPCSFFKAWNKKIFEHIHKNVDKASKNLAEERGPCPDAADYGIMERFSNKTAIAPTEDVLK